MIQNRKKRLILIISSFTQFFIGCSQDNDKHIIELFNITEPARQFEPPINKYNKEWQESTLTMNYDYKKPEPISLPSEETQLLQSPIRITRSCCEWPYRWKYSREDEVQWNSENSKGTKEEMRTISCLISLGFGIFAASNTCLNMPTTCLFSDSIIGKITLWTCTASWLICTFNPCCNQKAWDNGEFCNRCIRKNNN